MKGTVYLVGAGPGDPGLITHRGLELLRRADVVVHDRLPMKELLSEARTGARLIDVGPDQGSPSQRRVNRLLEKHSQAGRTVVRLKVGDPFLFGRGVEEAEWLAGRSIPFEVVPGVTAALASAAYAGIPLTHRARSSQLTFLTGLSKDDKPFKRTPPGGTLVIYMAIRTLPRMAETLIKSGWDPATPVAVVERGTTPAQRVLTGRLDNIAGRARKARLAPPALAIVGSVVELRKTLAWFDRRSLIGLRTIVTRAHGQAGSLSHRLRELGADVVEYPTVDIVPVVQWKPVDAVLRDLAHYDAVVFTSQNTVPLVFDRLRSLGLDARAFGGMKIAAVGPATAEVLDRHGIRPDWIAEEFTTAALAKKIAANLPPGARVLHPGADKRSPQLEAELRRHGIHVRNVDVYRIARPRSRPLLRSGDLVVFASSQTVKNFVDMTKFRPPAACIGPVTAKTARTFGFRVAVQASPYTFPALIDAVVRWRNRQKEARP